MKYCQGTKCHQYKTKDRIKGTKGSRVIKQEEDQTFIMARIIFVL